jgi:hypothetical protein
MGTRPTVYFCDWCGADSPTPGSIPHGWRVNQLGTTGPKEHICVDCVVAGEKAVDKVKAERKALRRSPQAKETDHG